MGRHDKSILQVETGKPVHDREFLEPPLRVRERV